MMSHSQFAASRFRRCKSLCVMVAFTAVGCVPALSPGEDIGNVDAAFMVAADTSRDIAFIIEFVPPRYAIDSVSTGAAGIFADIIGHNQPRPHSDAVSVEVHRRGGEAVPLLYREFGDVTDDGVVIGWVARVAADVEPLFEHCVLGELCRDEVILKVRWAAYDDEPYPVELRANGYAWAQWATQPGWNGGLTARWE